MPEGHWETWLRTRFPGYLLRSAAGSPRPAVEVERAFSRFTGHPGALSRLASLGFLLDPKGSAHALICDELPRYLDHVYPVVQRELDVRHGSARGRIDWGRTLALRTRTRDQTWFVGITSQRSFETPELMLIRWLLDRVLARIRDLRIGTLEDREGFLGELSRIHRSASECSNRTVLRDVAVVPPSPDQLARCARSRDPAVRSARRLAAFHAELFPDPSGSALVDSVSRFALAPIDVHKRFELFVLLSAMDVVDRCFPDATRADSLIESGRDEVATWRLPGGRLKLWYDKSPEPGVHRDVMSHFHGRPATIRPDVRFTFESQCGTRELYLDAKDSDDPAYLGASHLKMLGYIADRPRAFVRHGPKVVLVCPEPVAGEPRPFDDVIYVGSDQCGEDGRLEWVLRDWLAAARAHVPASEHERGTVAFFPWAAVAEAVILSDCVVKRYERGDPYFPEPVHAALDQYLDGSRHPVSVASVLEVAGSTTALLEDDLSRTLLPVAELLAFAALRRRRFFRSGAADPRVGADAFELVIRRWNAGAGGMYLVPRSRGASSGVFIAPEVLEVQAPIHVEANTELELDRDLVLALDRARSTPEWEWIHDCLWNFNRANTDAAGVPEHAELIMTVSALQQLLGMPTASNETALADALLALMDSAVVESRTNDDCPRPAARARKRLSLRDAWFRDLYISRGTVAHGRSEPSAGRAWSMREHLLLSAYIVPRLMLVRLDALGLYRLRESDRAEIARFDDLLCLPDLFEKVKSRMPGWTEWAWDRVLSGRPPTIAEAPTK